MLGVTSLLVLAPRMTLSQENITHHDNMEPILIQQSGLFLEPELGLITKSHKVIKINQYDALNPIENPQVSGCNNKTKKKFKKLFYSNAVMRLESAGYSYTTSKAARGLFDISQPNQLNIELNDGTNSTTPISLHSSDCQCHTLNCQCKWADLLPQPGKRKAFTLSIQNTKSTKITFNWTLAIPIAPKLVKQTLLNHSPNKQNTVKILLLRISNLAQQTLFSFDFELPDNVLLTNVNLTRTNILIDAVFPAQPEPSYFAVKSCYHTRCNPPHQLNIQLDPTFNTTYVNTVPLPFNITLNQRNKRNTPPYSWFTIHSNPNNRLLQNGLYNCTKIPSLHHTITCLKFPDEITEAIAIIQSMKQNILSLNRSSESPSNETEQYLDIITDIVSSTISIFDNIITIKQQPPTDTRNITILENASLIKSYIDLYLSVRHTSHHKRTTTFHLFPFNSMRVLRKLLSNHQPPTVVTINNPYLATYFHRQVRSYPGFFLNPIHEYVDSILDPILQEFQRRLSTLETQISQLTYPQVSYGYSKTRTKRGFWKAYLGFTEEEDVNRIVKNSLLTNNELFENNFQVLEKAILEQEKSLLKNNNALSQIYEATCKLAKHSNDHFNHLQKQIQIDKIIDRLMETLEQCSNGKPPGEYTFKWLQQICKVTMPHSLCTNMGHRLRHLMTCKIINITITTDSYLVEMEFDIPTSYQNPYQLFKPIALPVYDKPNNIWHYLHSLGQYRVARFNDTTIKILTNCKSTHDMTLCPTIREINPKSMNCLTSLLSNKTATCFTQDRTQNRDCFTVHTSQGLLVSSSKPIPITKFDITDNLPAPTSTKNGIFLLPNHPQIASSVTCDELVVTTRLQHTGPIKTIQPPKIQWNTTLPFELLSPYLKENISSIDQDILQRIQQLEDGIIKSTTDKAFLQKLDKYLPTDKAKRGFVTSILYALFSTTGLIFLCSCYCCVKNGWLTKLIAFFRKPQQ